MSEKLKPCPFCGSEEVYVEEYEHHPGAVRWRVLCAGCMAGIDTGTRQSAGDAVLDWNRRAERTCGEWRGDPSPNAISDSAAHEGDELWCEHCDIELDDDWSYCPYCGAKVVDE